MKFVTTIIITVILVMILQGCSVIYDKSPEITTIANSEENNRDLYVEISEKIHQENAEISDDLLRIPSLLTQVQGDNVLELYPDGDSIRYNYNKKIESTKTSLVYDEIAVEITPLQGFTIEQIISAFSDTFTSFEIDGDECCAWFAQNEANNQTVVNLLFFEPSKKCKCFITTKVEGLLDLSKNNVENIYRDFILTTMQDN